MAPFEMSIVVEHPYKSMSDAHSHLAPTTLRMPSFSANAVPFRWLLREEALRLAEDHDLGYREELEERADKLIGWSAVWVQDRRNQLVLEDTFFSAIRPQESLCFFYAKQTPLAEDHRRVLLGAGLVRHMGESTEYEVATAGELRSMLWERAIHHSIRPEMKEGFLFPYHSLWERSLEDDSFRPEPYVAFVPDEHFDEFSYTAEHVSHDVAISMLLTALRTLTAITEDLGGDYTSAKAWIDHQLGRLWKLRGAFPGLGAALAAFGISRGHLVAYALAEEMAENQDPWPLVDRMFADRTSFGVEEYVGQSLAQKWGGLPDQRKALLKLLARFDLTSEQAIRLYVPEERARARINVSDEELLGNPYRLYECDRLSKLPLTVTTIDRGVFSAQAIQKQHPLPSLTRVDDNLDSRRIRAFAVSLLEAASAQGDTLLQQSSIVRDMRDLAVQPACSVDADLLNVLHEDLRPQVKVVEMGDGSPAYQLDRLAEMGQLIHRTISKRAAGRRHVVEADWRALLDSKLGNAGTDESEERAREEKSEALREMAEARVSVLVGSAGTGKTTLLSVLCNHPTIQGGGVLLLAPTGKARVQIEQRAGLRPAFTVAQFLLKVDRYDPQTDVYRLSDRLAEEGARTVVIDEASMLTEEQLAALLDSLKGVERLILVGDPRQLPPIGSGRPFVDVISHLVPKDVEQKFPRVGPSYAELTVPRRHVRGASRRDLTDLTLASWFSGRDPGAGADEVWERIGNEDWSEALRFVRWDDPADLHNLLIDVLVDELELEDRDDVEGFERSIGGSEFGGFIYFHRGRAGQKGAGAAADRWQVLSPLRGHAPVTTDINRLIQRHFREDAIARANSRGFGARVPKPFPPEEIVYGDKVINVRNKIRKDVWPKEASPNYVANGEIGVVVGQFRGKKAKYKKRPWKLEVEFSSQPGFQYDFKRWEFGDEGNPPLELAYGITVHKSQGSEFEKTILVLPNPCRLLSRELLYTALTRQQSRVVVLHQGDFSHLKRYASPSFSETARRLTNIFQAPTPVKVLEEDEIFLEDRLIHRTRRGDLVRSKSEVIIADLLFSKGIKDYEYEGRLTDPQGNVRYPDFVVEDQETGRTYYWEHLGMLEIPEYRARWEKKLDWYRQQDILEMGEGAADRVLIVTKDDQRGGVDSSYFETIVDKMLEGV